MQNWQENSITILRWVACATVLLFMSACAYMHSAVKQAGYAQTQKSNPSQHNLKHMVERKTFFVHGRIVDPQTEFAGRGFSIAAYCSRFRRNELVDYMHDVPEGTHYGLNLPAGEYDIVVFADQNDDQIADRFEVVARDTLYLDPVEAPGRVVNNGDIRVAAQEPLEWSVRLELPAPQQRQNSVFYPRGTIRQLADPLFDTDIALLGLYEPAAFMERGSTMFYALEEDSYKIPVIFVHGIGGSPRDFQPLIDQLDRQRYQPWFFYYPSGSDLDQLADLFYDIFLSGRLVQRDDMPLAIVAHSAGGLVVREALNSYQNSEHENRVALFVSLASPFGGHPSAAIGVRRAPVVIPSWRSLDPQSEFINGLFRRPLRELTHDGTHDGTHDRMHDRVTHHLLYALGKGWQNRREMSDGVVPVASQLRDEALAQADEQAGFATGHVGILADAAAGQYVLDVLDRVENVFPQTHLQYLRKGGFAVDLGSGYSAREIYYITRMGRYLQALANGSLQTQDSEVLQRFVQVAQGRETARSDVELAWQKFTRDYPAMLLE